MEGMFKNNLHFMEGMIKNNLLMEYLFYTIYIDKT